TVGGSPVWCLLDTGSECTILNPLPGETDNTDPLFGRMETTEGSPMSISCFKGVMHAKKHVQVLLSMDGVKPLTTTGVVLADHIEGFPHVLLGRRTLLFDLGGVEMRWDEQHREISVEFGKWP